MKNQENVVKDHILMFIKPFIAFGLVATILAIVFIKMESEQAIKDGNAYYQNIEQIIQLQINTAIEDSVANGTILSTISEEIIGYADADVSEFVKQTLANCYDEVISQSDMYSVIALYDIYGNNIVLSTDRDKDETIVNNSINSLVEDGSNVISKAYIYTESAIDSQYDSVLEIYTPVYNKDDKLIGYILIKPKTSAINGKVNKLLGEDIDFEYLLLNDKYGYSSIDSQRVEKSLKFEDVFGKMFSQIALVDFGEFEYGDSVARYSTNMYLLDASKSIKYTQENSKYRLLLHIDKSEHDDKTSLASATVRLVLYLGIIFTMFLTLIFFYFEEDKYRKTKKLLRRLKDMEEKNEENQ